MGTKVIFFDVDGTLMDFDMKIPESANGHKTFICSGRVRIVARDPRLIKMGFDGLISGCGTMVEYGDEELFYYRIPQDIAIRTVEVLRKCRFEIMLEGKDVCYVYLDEFDLESQPEGLRESLRGKITSLPGNYGNWEFSKLICKTNPKVADRDTAIRELSDFYTFQIHNQGYGDRSGAGASRYREGRHLLLWRQCQRSGYAGCRRHRNRNGKRGSRGKRGCGLCDGCGGRRRNLPCPGAFWADMTIRNCRQIICSS